MKLILVVMIGAVSVELQTSARSVTLRKFEAGNGYGAEFEAAAVRYANQVADVLGCPVVRIDFTR